MVMARRGIGGGGEELGEGRNCGRQRGAGRGEELREAERSEAESSWARRKEARREEEDDREIQNCWRVF